MQLDSSTVTQPSGDNAADTRPGTSRTYSLGRKLNTYLISMFVTGSALMAVPSGLAGVLLPNKTYALFPEDAVARDSALAMILAISALFTLVTQPLVGMISDRTGSRIGRRAPFMLIGAIAGFLFSYGLQSANTVLTVTVFWVLVQVAINTISGPFSTTIPDRVPAQRRGLASSLVGITAIVGGTLGALAAGRLMNAIGDPTFLLFGAVLLVIVLLFVLLNPDASSKKLQIPPFTWASFARNFVINPRKHPDFAWAFAGRFLLMLGYWAIQIFQFNLMLAYVQPNLMIQDVNVVVGNLGLITMGGSLIASFVFGPLSDKIGRRKPFVIGASVGMAVALAIPMLSPTLPAFYVWAAINGLAFGAYMAIDMALIIDVLPDPATAGKDLGVMNVATVLPQALGPVIAASISAAFGYQYLFVWAIFWVLLAALAILPIKKTR